MQKQRLLSLTDDWQRDSLKVRTGRFKPVKGKSILLCINGSPSLWMERFVNAFGESQPRENIFFIEKNVQAGAAIRGRDVFPYPVAFLGTTSRYLRKLRVALVLVDDGVIPPRHFIRQARSKQIATAYVGGESGVGIEDGRKQLNTRQYNGEVAISGLQGIDASDAVKYFSPLIAREMAPHIKLKKRIRLFIWRHFLFRFKRGDLRKLTSFDEIYRSLGSPGSILCLGNGPSSEDSCLEKIAPDAVFRVNHRWLDRGLYDSPDAIFTGAVETLLQVGKEALYVFSNSERAMQMVNRARKEVPRLSFSNAKDLGFPLDEFEPYQPTNGLFMIYVAVNLPPAALTVAGIDLFSDPRGPYPDESAVPNHYTSAHDRKRELDFLLKLLASYRGELTIVGEQLNSAFERYLRENTIAS